MRIARAGTSASTSRGTCVDSRPVRTCGCRWPSSPRSTNSTARAPAAASPAFADWAKGKLDAGIKTIEQSTKGRLGVGLIDDLEDHPVESPARWTPRMSGDERERLLKGWRAAVRAAIIAANPEDA